MRARLALTALVALTAAGCGKSVSSSSSSSSSAPAAPATGVSALAFPAQATQNTTRIGSGDPVDVAAAVARIVYPSVGRTTRPSAVVLVDRADWRAGIAASVLSAPPLGAPILLTAGAQLPPATQATLARMRPSGLSDGHGPQVILIGHVPAPRGLRSVRIAGAGLLGLDGAIATFAAAARGVPAREVMIVSADRPAYAMPAAALAAESGVPVLLTNQDALSARTRAALAALDDPRIYVIGPTAAVGEQVVHALRALGTVVRIAGRTPTGTSVALARYTDSRFGWGVGRPGHGLVFASAAGNPQLAAAAAGLSTSGSYGPLVLLGDPGLLDLTVQSYLTDLRPHSSGDPAHGLYNHAWIVGDEAAVSVALQAQIDRLLEITTAP